MSERPNAETLHKPRSCDGCGERFTDKDEVVKLPVVEIREVRTDGVFHHFEDESEDLEVHKGCLL